MFIYLPERRDTVWREAKMFWLKPECKVVLTYGFHISRFWSRFCQLKHCNSEDFDYRQTKNKTEQKNTKRKPSGQTQQVTGKT